MSNGRMLVVEDDFDISSMLKIYFTIQGYNVETVSRGNDALDICFQHPPDIMILDIMLPDTNGYYVCEELRNTSLTRHIPIIFLTQKDERSDRIQGLELGADHYITKPFDIEELNLIVRTTLRVHRNLNMMHPITGLPSDRLISEELHNFMAKERWTYLDLDIENIDAFRDLYGNEARNEVLRFTSSFLNNVLGEVRTRHDLIGHTIDNSFIIITLADNISIVSSMVNKIRQQFSEEILSHYNIEDREQGGVLLKDGSVAPLMVLSIGSVTQEGSFTNLEEITDFARELRYMDALSSRTPSKTSLSPAPFWGSEPEIIQWLANIVSWTIVGVQLEFAHAYPKLEGGRQKLLQIIVETFVQAGELHGRDTDRLFYLAGGRFVLVTQSTKIEQLKNAIHDQFRERVNSLLSEAGQTLSTAQADPAVDISISEVNPQQESIHDISQLSQRLFTKTEHDEANLIELIDANETKALRETDWVRFRIYLEKYFDLNELETLCFDLGVDYEAIGGDSKSEKCRKLIEFCQRHVIVAKLIAHCQKARPAVRWSRHSSFP